MVLIKFMAMPLRRVPISIPLSELEVAAKCCSQHV